MTRPIIVVVGMALLCVASIQTFVVSAKAQASSQWGYPTELDIQDRLRDQERDRARLDEMIRLGDPEAIQRCADDYCARVGCQTFEEFRAARADCRAHR
jgi:hypothetical protein